jgi:hypothetical protein
MINCSIVTRLCCVNEALWSMLSSDHAALQYIFCHIEELVRNKAIGTR